MHRETPEFSARLRRSYPKFPGSPSAFAVLGALALAIGVGCSADADDTDDSGLETGGTAGTSGSAGTTGGTATGGTGTGGTSTGGTATGGTGTGGAGTGGAGVTGGSGGAFPGGAGGMPTGGSGGSAGMAGGGKGGLGGSGGKGGAGGGGGKAECTPMATFPSPPSEMQQTIDITWDEMTGELSGRTGARGNSRAIQTYPSWALDHVMWSGGSLNFCVRWDSEQPVSTTLRDQVADALQRGVDAWFTALYGYDCFPFERIDVNITGWATRNRATFQWTDDAFVPLFINQLSGGAPDCPDTCSRNRHQQESHQFQDCPGGFDNRFDQEVWLTENYTMPNGWDFGQHVDRAGFTNRVTGALYHIWLHEFGHGIGFPDYYDWDVWAPGVAAPACVMNAGRATVVTDWDKWMFKRTWSELLRMGRWD
jgi:hypothetical protein